MEDYNAKKLTKSKKIEIRDYVKLSNDTNASLASILNVSKVSVANIRKGLWDNY